MICAKLLWRLAEVGGEVLNRMDVGPNGVRRVVDAGARPASTDEDGSQGNPPCDPNPKLSSSLHHQHCSIRRASGLVQTGLPHLTRVHGRGKVQRGTALPRVPLENVERSGRRTGEHPKHRRKQSAMSRGACQRLLEQFAPPFIDRTMAAGDSLDWEFQQPANAGDRCAFVPGCEVRKRRVPG